MYTNGRSRWKFEFSERMWIGSEGGIEKKANDLCGISGISDL
jgi:hypothetical protein